MNNKKSNLTIDRTQLPYLGLFVALLWATPNAEANWQFSPEIGVGIEHDDNTRLNDVTGSSGSDTSYGIDARATFFYGAELTEFVITPRVRSEKYDDNSDLDSDDLFLRLDFRHTGQKSSFRMRGNYSSESVRTAERSDVDFDIEDPDEIPADDTARVFDTGKRDRLRLVPEFSYDLTQRTSLRVRGDYRDTSYDSAVSQALTGYAKYTVGTSLEYSWSQKDAVSLNAYAGSFESDGSGVDSGSTGFGLGYNRKLSERTQFRLLVGGDSSEDSTGVDQSNGVGEISFIHRYETTRVIASYQRRVNGSGSGSLSLRDAVSLNVIRDLSPKLTLRGGVRAYSTEALDPSDTDFEERDYLQVRAALRWNVSRTVSIDLDYRYTDVDRNVTGVSALNADSNQAGLWFFWHPVELQR